MKGTTAFLFATALGVQALAADPAGNMPRSDTPGGMSDANAIPSGMMAPGGMMDATAITTTFTVQSIDAATRMITLKAPDGSIEKFKAGPEIRNFDQLHQGDMVRATVMDEIAVSMMQPGGQQPAMGQANMVAVAPKGAKPGVVMVQTENLTAKVAAIDTQKRMVSLEEPSGNTRTIKVSPRVDIAQIKKGDDITLQIAQGFAIMVESPQAQPSGASMQPNQ